MYFVFLAVVLLQFSTFFILLINTQQVGKQTEEKQPDMNIQICTTSPDSCKMEPGKVTIDLNWRWIHSVDGSTNCYTGNLWDPKLCPDDKTCTEKCAVDGADYPGTYGVTSTGDALTLKFVTHAPYSINIGSRLYLLNGEKYRMFNLKSMEFSFDVDVSKLPCGINGALYFAAMDEDGGMSKFPTNKAGAKYGTGYCDAQCPQDIKFIGGQSNSENWIPDKDDENTGRGQRGSCCAEMDVWEANKISQAFTPHVCKSPEPTVCLKDACGNDKGGRYQAPCDKDGCDFASYRWGAKEFYGEKKKVDTTKPFTVITRFITSDGTPKGDLTEIRRIYIQGDQTIQNEAVTLPTLTKPADSITQGFCDATKKFTGDTNDFKIKGGMKAMGDAMERGMVLVMSLWDDKAAFLQWLDGVYPPDKNPTDPGVERGTCPATSGKPSVVRKESPDAAVVFSKLKFGPIGSTNSVKDDGSVSSTTSSVTPKTCKPKGTTSSTTSTSPESRRRRR